MLEDSLNPMLLEDPLPITFFGALKRGFDLNVSYAEMNALVKKSEYEVDIDIYLHPTKRKESDENKLNILKILYTKCCNKICSFIKNKQSCFYCKNFYNQSSECDSIFENIPVGMYHGEFNCSKDKPKMFEHMSFVTSKLILKDFNNKKIEFDLIIMPDGIVLRFLSVSFIKEQNTAVKIKIEDFNKFLEKVYLNIFFDKVNDLENLSYTFEYDTKNIDTNFSQKIILFDKLYRVANLQQNIEVIEKELNNYIEKNLKIIPTLLRRERKICNFIKSKGFNIPAYQFMQEYYPTTDIIELLEMALASEGYDKIIEKVVKSGEICSYKVS